MKYETYRQEYERLCNQASSVLDTPHMLSTVPDRALSLQLCAEAVNAIVNLQNVIARYGGQFELAEPYDWPVREFSCDEINER